MVRLLAERLQIVGGAVNERMSGKAPKIAENHEEGRPLKGSWLVRVG